MCHCQKNAKRLWISKNAWQTVWHCKEILASVLGHLVFWQAFWKPTVLNINISCHKNVKCSESVGQAYRTGTKRCVSVYMYMLQYREVQLDLVPEIKVQDYSSGQRRLKYFLWCWDYLWCTLDFTPEIEVLHDYMMFQRCRTKDRNRSNKQHMKDLDFQSKVQLDHPVEVERVRGVGNGAGSRTTRKISC